MAKQTAADLARKLIAKCPDAPARTLARDLHKKYPVIFPTIDRARSCVRRELGVNGKVTRKAPSPLHRKPRKPGQFCIPRGLHQIDPPVHLDNPGKWLVISDVHCPFHDRVALMTALDYGVAAGCEHVVIHGDFYDNPRLSRWDRPPGTLDPQKDLDIGRKILEQIAAAFPGRKIYKIGNHDAWYELYLAQNAPELANCKHFRIAKFLELDELGYEMIASKQEYSLGKLAMYHGHELPKGLTDPVNVARGVFLRVQEAALVGHWHRTSHHVETSARKGKIVATYSIGCLCYSSDTEVLTKRGFVKFPELLDGDLVAEYDPDTTTLNYRQPIAIQRFAYDGPMHRFESPRVDLMVTPEHKMLHVKDGQWFQGSAECVAKRHTLTVPVAGQFVGNNDGITADYARLLCWIITEGTIDTSGRGCRISIYQKKPHRVREIRALLMRLGIKTSHSIDNRNGVRQFRINSESSRAIVSVLNNDKTRIPRVLLNSRVGVLRAAYETLIAGDSSRTAKGSDYFATIHRGLTDDFQELCCKIGYSARVKDTVMFTKYAPDGARIFRCQVRKAAISKVLGKSVQAYVGDVYDITTDSGFFVVRRGGLVSISGNCNLKPSYAPVNKWNSGCAVIDVAEDGTYQVENKIILKGKVY